MAASLIMKKTKLIIISLALLICLLFGFGWGYILAENLRPSIEKIKGVNNAEISKPQDVDFSVFWDAWKTIEEKFVDRKNLDRQKMVYGAVSGLVRSLDDPYSVFMEPVESKKFQDDISGSFEGIGAEIGIRKEILTIIAPLKDSPAQKAGLLAGDKVLKIDDTITADLTIDEAVNKIRGPGGTEVKLMIAREGWTEAKEFKNIRNKIKIPIIDFEIKNNNIAYVQISHFTSNLSNEFKDIVKQILNAQPKGIVLDLRNNPGGYLEVAVDIASYFLAKGEVVAIEDFGNGDKQEYRSAGYKLLAEYPMVILVNEGSASAAEILAGALRDDLGIKLVGQKTFGKGSVQELEEMQKGASLKITIAKWLTPKGTCIHENGLDPDIKVELTEKDIEELKDPQLEKALELLK